MKTLVIYHADCWDGFCAAWIARKRFGDIEAVPVRYSEPMPDVSGRDVLILDFSYSRAQIKCAVREANSLFVIDHHKTAEVDLEGLDCALFDANKSGGRLAWEHWYGNTPAPWLVDYTEDRDLWRHALPQSQEINAALRSYPLDFELWDSFAGGTPEYFVLEGVAIRRAEKQIIDAHVRNARLIEFDGYTVKCVNATTLFSEIAGKLAKGQAFGACYFDRQDGLRQWSLRSDENGVDVSALAKKYGGGGHFHAAGFEEKLDIRLSR